MFPQVLWIRLPPYMCGKKCRPLQSPRRWEPRSPPLGCPLHLAQPVEEGSGRARVPRELAALCGAASPAISRAHHLSIHAHKPGSEPPAFESSTGGGMPLPPSLRFCPLWRASRDYWSRWS